MFQRQCEKFISKLNVTDIHTITNLNNDLERFKYVYPLTNDWKIELSTRVFKDIERADAIKITGNALFKQRDFSHAIGVYNDALMRCPQDCVEGQKLHDVIIANRSAVFFELNQHKKVLQDVENLKKYGNHPSVHKVYVRASKSCEALKKYASAKRYLSSALDKLKRNKEIKNEDKIKQIEEIEARLLKLKECNIKTDIDDTTNQCEIEESVLEKPNKTYPAFSSKITVTSSDTLGRYVIAKEDIKPGEILAIEKPFVSVVCGQKSRTNCATCLKSTNQPLFCKTCTSACFCCFECKDVAKKSFHKNECKILLTLFDADASVNCLMALRMITQYKVSELLAQQNIYNLVSHDDKRNTAGFIDYAFMSTYLLSCLKCTGYFGKSTSNGILTEEEALVGSILLKNLQILQYNAHEIFELEHNSSTKKDDSASISSTIGAGIYPTLAYFNHSCDPSLSRYNLGNVMVLCAIRSIKKNEGVYENYGPLYMSDPCDERRSNLKKLYCFDCNCIPCTENWPLFKDIDYTHLRISCHCGKVISADPNLEEPFVECGTCNRKKKIMPILIDLMPLQEKLNKSEELIEKKLYKEAIAVISEVLQTYFKHLTPPFKDMVLSQHKLKTCLTHLGNKKYDYDPKDD